ncbi:MAG: hypothetical protein KY475_11540 [Planctomycetes bacterium]|nr:hypothetical protein [Planctomycetota bacterium]
MQIEKCKLQIGVAVAALLCAFPCFAQDEGHESETLRGRVVWLFEAMGEEHGVTVVPEAEKRVIALQTTDGRLVPIVEDVRGRGFRRDERLRKMGVELLVRRFDDSPFAQVIRLYEIKDGSRYELDYWCDICAIAMYELKHCDCCQGPIELRRREVK